MALKVTTNIDTLIKDLFHNPPSYKNTITLSWKILEVSLYILKEKRHVSDMKIKCFFFFSFEFRNKRHQHPPNVQCRCRALIVTIKTELAKNPNAVYIIHHQANIQQIQPQMVIANEGHSPMGPTNEVLVEDNTKTTTNINKI